MLQAFEVALTQQDRLQHLQLGGGIGGPRALEGHAAVWSRYRRGGPRLLHLVRCYLVDAERLSCIRLRGATLHELRLRRARTGTKIAPENHVGGVRLVALPGMQPLQSV